MRDIIALDIDGVLANTEEIIRKYLFKRFNLILNWDMCEDFRLENIPGVSNDMVEETLNALYNDLIKDVLPYNDAGFALDKLYNHGLKIILVTARPSWLKNVTIEWLNKWSLNFHEVYHIDSLLKYTIIKDLNAKAFIEDRPDILEMIYDHVGNLKYGLYLINRPWNLKYNIRYPYSNYISRVENILIAVDHIIKYKIRTSIYRKEF